VLEQIAAWPLPRPFVVSAAVTPLRDAAWHDVPSIYVVTLRDSFLHPVTQREMATRATRVTEMDCDDIMAVSQTKSLSCSRRSPQTSDDESSSSSAAHANTSLSLTFHRGPTAHIERPECRTSMAASARGTARMARDVIYLRRDRTTVLAWRTGRGRRTDCRPGTSERRLAVWAIRRPRNRERESRGVLQRFLGVGGGAGARQLDQGPTPLMLSGVMRST
jgi:hypothetical protein